MSWQSLAGAIALGLIVLQLPPTFLLLSRLLRGARRQPPILPKTATSAQQKTVSVIVPTLNEAHRIEPCLAGLSQQGKEVREILIVDSRSTDGTQAKVAAMAQQDPRIRLVTDEPLPDGWVGRPWALHTGYLHADPASDWIVGIDADTQPQPGLVASILQAAETQGYDIVSLSPRFILQSAGEWWLQPALLMTLVYRFDSAGVGRPAAERVMANGQCFLSRRSVLAEMDGYRCAAASFCDDVTLARAAAQRGFRVGFLDGAKVLSVRMYEGFVETWQGWGRSLDLKDAASKGQLWADLWMLVCTQGLALPALLLLAGFALQGLASPMVMVALGLNLFLLLVRVGMQAAVAGSYHWPQRVWSVAQCFWLAPLADPLAALRIGLSSFQSSIRWRGRVYQKGML